MWYAVVAADEGKVYGVSLLDRDRWTGACYVGGGGTPALRVGTI